VRFSVISDHDSLTQELCWTYAALSFQSPDKLKPFVNLGTVDRVTSGHPIARQAGSNLTTLSLMVFRPSQPGYIPASKAFGCVTASVGLQCS